MDRRKKIRKIGTKLAKVRAKSAITSRPVKVARAIKKKRAPIGKGLRKPIPVAIVQALIKEAIAWIKGGGKGKGPGKKVSLNDAVKWVGKHNIELHLKRIETLQKYSFAGPGTNLKKRLDKNNKPLPFSKPLNILDAAAYKHDLAYNKHEDVKNRNKADAVLAKACVRQIEKAKYPSDVRNALFVWKVMRQKVNNKV